jgi:hypothetical protein
MGATATSRPWCACESRRGFRRHSVTRPLALLCAVVACHAGTACAEERPGPSAASEAQAGREAQVAPSRSPTVARRMKKRERSQPTRARARTIVGTDGARTILAPLPRTYRTTPSSGCERAPAPAPGTPRRLLPPSPGLSARQLTRDTVEVHYGLPADVAKCRPWRLLFVLYTSRGRTGSINTERKVRRRMGTARLRVPPWWDAPPEVVRAETWTKNGAAISPMVSVLID